MTTHPDPDLRTTLHRLADATEPLPVADDVWQRGRAARRRGQVLVVAAVLAILASVGGVATLVSTTDREARTASGEVVPGGAIPSRIPEPEGPVLTDLAIGSASVAYVDATGAPVLVDAATGRARPVELPSFPESPVDELDAWFDGPWLALSPDGRRLAYPATTLVDRGRGQMAFLTSWYVVVDLATGTNDLVDVPPGTGTPRAVSWTADGRLAVDVRGRPTREDRPPPLESRTFDVAGGGSTASALTGLVSPGGAVSAVFTGDESPVRAVPFESADGRDLGRELPADLYPDGAAATPVGWADTSLLVAEVDAPAGSYVEGRHLVLLTSPDRPKVEWTYRILVRDVPATPSLSLAVDLIPDLDGTSAQQLTHDFDRPAGERDISWLIGLGVTAAIGVLLGLRLLWRRLVG